MYVVDRHDMQLNPITQVYIYSILCKNRIIIYSVLFRKQLSVLPEAVYIGVAAGSIVDGGVGTLTIGTSDDRLTTRTIVK